jgi:mRNA-degrading endonuclease toxin of MazEF toxin-antitoxin module
VVERHRTSHTGDVFWVDDFPPLDGNQLGRHPVIVVDDPVALNSGCPEVLVVGVTTTTCDDHDQIELPNEADHPGTTTGLPQQCCALPRWFVPVERARLRDRAGHLPRATLERLLSAIEARWEEYDPSTE